MVLKIRRNRRSFILLIVYTLLFCACHPLIAEQYWHYYMSVFTQGGAYGLRFSQTNLIIGIPLLLLYCFYGSQISILEGMKYKIHFMLIVLYFIPLTVSSFMITFDTTYLVLSFIYFVLLVIFDWFISTKIGGNKLGTILAFSNDKRNKYFILISTLLVLLAIIIGYSYGNGFAMLFVDDVYVIRALNKAKQTHWIIIAIYKFLVYAMAVLAYYFIKKKQYFLLVLAGIGAILIYSIACMKSYLYVFIISVLCSIISSRVELKKMPFVMAIIALLGIVSYKYLSNDMIINVFRRYCITPAQLGDGYYAFIIKDGNPPVWISESLSRVANILHIYSPYSENLEYVIGKYWYGLSIDANTGLLGAGIGNYGLIAVIICPLGLAITNNLVDRFTRRIKSDALQFVIALVLVTEMMNQNYYNLEFIKPGWVILFMLFLTIIPDVNSVTDNKELANQ